MKLRIIAVIIVLLLIFGIFLLYSPKDKISVNESSEIEREKYQGPVPEGYDEEYFRETGITKKIGDKT